MFKGYHLRGQSTREWRSLERFLLQSGYNFFEDLVFLLLSGKPFYLLPNLNHSTTFKNTNFDWGGKKGTWKNNNKIKHCTLKNSINENKIN